METVELLVILNMADMELCLELERGKCRLSIIDTKSGERAMIICTPIQAAAIWFLAINGDEGSEKLIPELYKIAEPVVANLPLNLRPIP